jgi:hypothetical protein
LACCGTGILDKLTYWFAWSVNDFGQIVGEASNGQGDYVGVLWNLLPNGKGWKLTQLPATPDYPLPEPFKLNDRREIAGDIEPADFSVWIPAYWKSLVPFSRTYSQPIVLAFPDGFAGGYGDDIDDVGDITGECWGEAGDTAVRWTTRDPTTSQVIAPFGASSSYSFGVNDARIAAVSYTDENCAVSCAMVIQLPR